MSDYPCKECIVRGNCSELCPSIFSRTLFNNSILKRYSCPDCGEGVISVFDICNEFYIITCIHCYSRFAAEFLTSTTKIIRSITPKGRMFERISDIMTIYTFLEQVKVERGIK